MVPFQGFLTQTRKKHAMCTRRTLNPGKQCISVCQEITYASTMKAWEAGRDATEHQKGAPIADSVANRRLRLIGGWAYLLRAYEVAAQLPQRPPSAIIDI